MFIFQARHAFEAFLDKHGRHADVLKLLAALHRDRTHVQGLLPEHGRSNNDQVHKFVNASRQTAKEVRASQFLSSLDRLIDDLDTLGGGGAAGPWIVLREKANGLRELYDTYMQEGTTAAWAVLMLAGADVYEQYLLQCATIKDWLDLTAKDGLRIAGHDEFTIQFHDRAVLSSLIDRLSALNTLYRLLSEIFNVNDAGGLEVADAEVGSFWAKFLGHPLVVAALTLVMTHASTLIAQASSPDAAMGRTKQHIDLMRQAMELKEKAGQAGIDTSNFDVLLEKNLQGIGEELKKLAGDGIILNDQPLKPNYVFLLDRQPELSFNSASGQLSTKRLTQENPK